MGNTVNPSSGIGTSSLTVTIVPSEAQASTLSASGYGLRDTVTFDQYDIVDIDPDGSALPICEDIQFVQDADKIEYHIYEDRDNLIYSGYAYRYPGSDNIEIELNDILSDHLHNHISFEEGLREMDGFLKEFTIASEVDHKMEAFNVYKA